MPFVLDMQTFCRSTAYFFRFSARNSWMGGACSLDQSGTAAPAKKRKANGSASAKKGTKRGEATPRRRRASAAVASSKQEQTANPLRTSHTSREQSASPPLGLSQSQKPEAAATSRGAAEAAEDPQAAQVQPSATPRVTVVTPDISPIRKLDSSPMHAPEPTVAPKLLDVPGEPIRDPQQHHNVDTGPTASSATHASPDEVQAATLPTVDVIHAAPAVEPPAVLDATAATPDRSAFERQQRSSVHIVSISSPSPTVPAQRIERAVPPSAPPTKPALTMAEVHRHNQRSDAWIVVRGTVFDVTPFARRHPGGSSVIVDAAGTDATSVFLNNHNEQTAWRALLPYEIGKLER